MLLSGRQGIQTLCLQLACRVFNMHHLDMGEQYSKRNNGGQNDVDDATDAKIGNNSTTGVSKIGGLPLPHASLVLYSVIPLAVLTLSLWLAASLTQLVASFLSVVLCIPF